MNVTRRFALGMGGGYLAALSLPWVQAVAEEVFDIAMTGERDGSRVWFDPIGARVPAGQVIRWTNRDAGNAHTATAYHSAHAGRPTRIPRDAKPWDSEYLLPGESFSVTLTVPGVYDYYCRPHEMVGMVGRIVVGAPSQRGWMDNEDLGAALPAAALEAFPPVDEIMRKGVVRRG